MHQTREGKPWHFGIKARIGVGVRFRRGQAMANAAVNP